jgi:hypothetical protein
VAAEGAFGTSAEATAEAVDVVEIDFIEIII